MRFDTGARWNRVRFAVAAALLTLLCSAGLSGLQAQTTNGQPLAASEVLVQFKPGVGEGRRAAVRALHGAQRVRDYAALGAERLHLPGNADPVAVARALAAHPDVAAAQPNFVRHRTTSGPNDPYWQNGSLWGLINIAASQAWTDFGDGNDTVVVADIDTGVDYTHPDLAAHMWKNPGEIPGNGIDDDHDGYIDDVYGINAIAGSGDPLDDNGHGSHTSGTFGAVTNNGVGIAGVAQNVRILACKFLDSQGYGADSDAVECLNYIVDQKQRGVNVRVTSNSWGSPRGSQPATVLQNAFDAAGNAGIVNVAAAGNNGTDNDTSPFDPASFTSPSIIAVAASDANDARASFSNYGATSVDLAAPGVAIWSTAAGSYAQLSGTSMATPHVAGAAALLLSHQPSLTVSQVKDLLLTNVDPLPQWNGVVASGGRLNVWRVLSGSGSNEVPTVALTSPTDGATGVAPGTFTVSATASDKDGTVAKVDFYANGAPIGTDSTAPYGVTWSNVAAGIYTLTAVATDNAGATTTSAAVTVTVSSGGGGTATTQTLLTTQVPATTFVTANYELGVRITSTVAGTINGIRFWKIAGENGSHIGHVWSATGQLLASVTFTGETASGWQQQLLSTPLPIAPNTEYLISVNSTSGLFAGTPHAFDSGLVNGALQALAGDNGRYGAVGQYPGGSSSATNYFRDVVFAPSGGGADVIAPTVTITQPANASTVGGTIAVSATATDNVGVAGVQFKVDGVNLGSEVTAAPYTASWATTNVTDGSHTVSAVARDAAGNTATSSVTVTVSNGGGGTGSTQTLLTTQVPATTFVTANYELGVRITSTVAGTINGIRFWKIAGENGTHIGHVWSATGQLLASVTFTGETASGWQQQLLSTPLPVAPNTEYLISVNSTSGLFAGTPHAFDSGLVNGALQALAGDNGRYGAVGQYPGGSSSATNYFRDVVFAPSGGGADVIAPTVTITQPANASTVSGTVAVSATATDNVGVAGVQFKVDGVNLGSEVTAAPYTASWATTSVTDGSHTVSAVARDAAGNTATSSVTVTVSNGGGGTGSTQTLLTTQVPATTYVTANYELGVRITSTVSGTINGIRFWKIAGETGTHIGHVWSATGQLLASVTFTGETASGWQQQLLATPLPIAANTEYLISVNSTSGLFPATFNAFDNGLVNGVLQAIAGDNGRYGAVGQYPGGSYAGTNYFRDVVFAPNAP